MASMNMSLPDEMRAWVQTQIEEGKYSSSSDYVRDLIRKDQEQRDKINAMQDAIDQGLRSGDPEEFDYTAFKSAMTSKRQ